MSTDLVRTPGSRVAPRRLRLVISVLMITAFAWTGMPVAAASNPPAGHVLILGMGIALGLISAELLRRHLAGHRITLINAGMFVVAAAFSCGGSVVLTVLGLLCAAGVILGVAILRHIRC